MKHLLAVVGLLAGLLAPELAAARGLDPLDAARLRSVDEVAVSPDGEHVAYTLTVPREPLREENGPARSELHVFDRATGTSRPFVSGEVAVSQIRWIDGGSHIAYRAKRGDEDGPGLWVIPVDGGESRRVAAVPAGFEEYAFGPQATRVAWIEGEQLPAEQQELVDAGFDMEVYEESALGHGLWVAGFDLDDPAAIAGPARRIDTGAHVDDLQWARNADRVLITLAPTSRIDDRYMRRQWATVDMDSGELVGRILTDGKLGEARISPDGRQVALIGPDSPNDPSAGRLMVAPATGGVPTTLLGREFAGELQSVRWAAGDEIVFLADEGVHSFVARIDARGGSMEKLVEGPRPVVTAIDLSVDGRVIGARAESANFPSELFVGRTDDGLARVTDSNPWLAEIELAPQRVVEWEARDGLGLQGILIAPVGSADPGEPWPLIVSVHGGPESHEQDGWKTTSARVGQCAAAEGFAVFYPNYRGSTGRGVEFSELSQGDPAGKEFDDIVDGVDYLVSTGLVDRERVGITGRSYGGFATAWGATYFSEVYAAAVMSVGISEQYSKFGTTDIPRESMQVHQHPRKVYEDWDFFRERSPIYHAAGSTTPLLIMHGAEDPRVHPTQSLILYRYFQEMADAPVRLVLYPGEPHRNRKAAGQLDYRVRMLRWMKHFLLEGGQEMPPRHIDYDAELARMRGDEAATSR